MFSESNPTIGRARSGISYTFREIRPYGRPSGFDYGLRPPLKMTRGREDPDKSKFETPKILYILSIHPKTVIGRHMPPDNCFGVNWEYVKYLWCFKFWFIGVFPSARHLERRTKSVVETRRATVRSDLAECIWDPASRPPYGRVRLRKHLTEMFSSLRMTL